MTEQERELASYTPQYLAEKILTSRSALEGEIGDLADKFYQGYWDVFHAAVETPSMERLAELVPAAIKRLL